MITLLPADTYIVKNNTILSDQDRNIIYKLYEPIIGSIAVNLYYTLWSDLDSLKIISKELTHHNLMVKTRLKLDNLLEAREKLEAIGLIKTYVKEGSINSYIYELYSPVTPKEFFDNPILATTLKNNIGDIEFTNTVNFFRIPSINLKDYQEITSSFSDTFKVTELEEYNFRNIRSINSLDLTLENKINLNDILASIPSEYLNHRTINKEIRDFIYKIAFIYNFNEDEMDELIKNSIDDRHMIDKQKLRENASNYYSFEHNTSMPTIIYKKQPDYLRKNPTENTKKAKLIHTFESMSPYEYLTGKNKGVRPSKANIAIIETLLIDYNLKPGVVNVLIDYVLKIKDNKLNKSYCLAIADQWKRSNIETVEEAIEICRKENKGKKRTTKKTIKEEKPDWYGKDIKEEEASEEDIKKLEAMLKR